MGMLCLVPQLHVSLDPTVTIGKGLEPFTCFLLCLALDKALDYESLLPLRPQSD